MKIKVGEKVYLQKFDVAFILHQLSCFPGSLAQEIFKDYCDDGFFFMGGLADGLRFSYIFEKNDNVEWLMEQDWILNYEAYAKTSVSELESLVERLTAERSANIDEFNAKDKAYREKHIEQIRDRFDKENHIINSLEALIDFRKGGVEFGFPEGYREDAIPNISNVTNNSGSAKTPDVTNNDKQKSNFLARLISHIFH